MTIDYDTYLPTVLKSLFPDHTERTNIETKLNAYSQAPFQREGARVKLGILYLARKRPGSLDTLIELACTDYRDLLCAAEYPYTSRQWTLNQSNPEQYLTLRNREENEYRAWLKSVTQSS